MGRLSGKTALITGATKGIGAAAAQLFAAEGAKVAVAGRDKRSGEEVVEQIRQMGGTAVFCLLDVTDYKSWETCIGFVEQTFGNLHILINNAGISYRETVEETTPQSWDKTIATNQTAIFYGMQLSIRTMKKHGENSAIVSTSSVDGVTGDAVFFSYCAAKAAVQAMTKSAALYCGENGLNIRVNAVAPGYILTPMAYEDARQNGQTIEEYCKETAALHPIGHLGKPEDIARAYLYLASDESAFVTGTTLMVDGGYTAR